MKLTATFTSVLAACVFVLAAPAAQPGVINAVLSASGDANAPNFSVASKLAGDIIVGTHSVAPNADHGVSRREREEQAKALYSYTASPDDPNEVSFTKGEILGVLDHSGTWWEVVTPSGQVGIAPGNYLQLLD